MPLPSTLSELGQRIRLEGEVSVANELLGEGLVDEAMELCRTGLRERAIAPEPFRLRLTAVLDGYDKGFCVHYTPGGETGAYVECPDRDDCEVRGGFAQILYIVAGSTLDQGLYRAHILTWFANGTIQASGDVMLLQKTQGFFS